MQSFKKGAIYLLYIRMCPCKRMHAHAERDGYAVWLSFYRKISKFPVGFPGNGAYQNGWDRKNGAGKLFCSRFVFVLALCDVLLYINARTEQG